jgi:hypothetical protein
MTPQLEEALRLLRLARRDQEVFLVVADMLNFASDKLKPA